MAVLSMINIEKNDGDTILFPAFSLDVAEKEVTAIYSTLNVRQILLNMFIGKTSIMGGELIVKGACISKNKQTFFKEVGVLFFDEGMYERLTVQDHFKFYKGLYISNQTFDQMLKITQLEAKKHTRLSRLTNSEKRRVQFARILFQNPSLFVFEEPDLNIDVETKRIFLTIIKTLQQKGKSVIVLTGNMESAITVAESVYRLDNNGLNAIELDTRETQEKESIQTEAMTNPSIQFNKIPTRVNEKLVLFEPPEIDYIESHDGQSNLYIKGEVFPCVFTLNELEKRLKPYGFFRCHRSYIVNLQKVREVITWTRNSYSLNLDDKPKSSIPLSKTKMVQLKEMLGL